MLRGQAVIERLVTTTAFDFSEVTSDLVVSCIDPGGSAPAPVVLVSPFLTSADIEHVLASVQAERARNARRRVRTTLTTLIDPRAYRHVGVIGSKEVALQTMCDTLVAAGYVEDTFYADVMDRERRSPTSFGGEFAIPHSLYMDANATGIAVLASDKGIPWGTSTVRLVMLFALSPDGRQTFRDVLDELIRLLSEGSNITTLLNASSDVESFMAALTSMLDA